MPSKIIFHSAWYLLIICFVFAIAMATLLYFKNKKINEISSQIIWTLFLLRFFSSFLIGLLFLNILLQQYKNETEKPLILIGLDNSLSIVSGSDSALIKSSLKEKIDGLEKDINEKYQTKIIHFGSNAKTSIENLTYKEKETDFENLFSEIENNYANQNIGAMILVSDGIYNKGANPLNSIAKIKYPIYTIGLGDTNQYKDLLIQKIEHNEIAYLGNNFLVEVIVASKKINNQNATLNITYANKIIQSKIIQINQNNFVSNVTFTLSAEQKGIQQFGANITILNDEKNTANNHYDFVIDVIDNKEKIALISNGAHPDLAALKQSIESKSNYSLECFNANNYNVSLNAYALIMIEGYTPSQSKLINECKQKNIPVWIINPESTENLPGIKLNVASNHFNETECYVDQSFSLFNISTELKKFITEAPALKTYFGNYTTINSANSLIKQKIGQIETENPILIFSEFNGCKCATFIGDGLWKWRMRNYAEKGNHELFDELISKTIQYLTVKKDKSYFRLRLPNKINENEALEVEAELYNKSYDLVNTPDVSFILNDAENHQYNYTFSKTNLAYKLNAGILKPGEYAYKATVKYNEELFVKQGKLIVNETVLEKANLVANHEVLNKISSKTNGQLFYMNQLESLKNTLLKNEQIKSITYSEIKDTYLIDLKWLIFVIVALLSLEWFLRKRFLMI